MNAERWKKVDAILDAVLEITPSERSVFLNDKCGGDENLRLEVTKLLATMEKAEDFLEAHPSNLSSNCSTKNRRKTLSEDKSACIV